MCLKIEKLYEDNDISRIAFKIMKTGYETKTRDINTGIIERKIINTAPITPFRYDKIIKNELYGYGTPSVSRYKSTERTNFGDEDDWLSGGAIHCCKTLKDAKTLLKLLDKNGHSIFMVLGHNIVAEGDNDKSIAFKRVEFLSEIECELRYYDYL